MRAAPALQFTLHRFGLWRGFVVVLSAAAAASLAAWIAPRAGVAAWAVPAAMAAALAAAAWCWPSTRRPPVRLRWDGSRWYLGDASRAADELVAGDLRATIDLDVFMLIRFAPERGAPTWLPAQRHGHEADWHAFRCAVYSPRPAAPESASADDASPPA